MGVVRYFFDDDRLCFLGQARRCMDQYDVVSKCIDGYLQSVTNPGVLWGGW